MEGFSGSVDLATVEELRRIATHVVARARFVATGRFSLRVTPGGFGTPEFGPDQRRVRVSGTTLIVESDAEGAATTKSKPIEGSALTRLAHTAGVMGLSSPFSVGHDTPPVGSLAKAIHLDAATVDTVGRWYATVGAVLDRVVHAKQNTGSPSLVRLWPEHFDLAVDLQARSGVRVNLGGSPGDAYLGEPYLYVGPWTDARPGGGTFWNAPFGAARPASALATADDAYDFLMEGVGRLAQSWAPPPMPG
jgi:hypothetical protein